MAYYGYIRVSTKGQVPGTSLAEQEQQRALSDCDYCKGSGFRRSRTAGI